MFDFESEGALATFWRQATPGTTYWRGYVPMKALPGNLSGVESDTLEWLDEEKKTIRLKQQRGDTAIWQFLGDDARSRIVLQMQRQGLRTLMDVDDTYLRFAPGFFGKSSPWPRTHAEAIANKTGYSVEMHRKQAPMVDGIICATEHLANEYEEFNDNIFHCPNSVDPSDWAVQREESENLRIGYYGSATHVRDWPLIKKGLKWAARQPNVEIVCIGFQPPGFTGTVIPWEDDLMKARANLGKIDIGLAPVTRKHWADGKSDLKALEYAMAGVMPIVQDAPPYSPWVNMGWEWKAKTAEDWTTLIKEIVTQRDLVKTLATAADNYVHDERTIDKSIHLWREAIHA